MQLLCPVVPSDSQGDEREAGSDPRLPPPHTRRGCVLMRWMDSTGMSVSRQVARSMSRSVLVREGSPGGLLGGGGLGPQAWAQEKRCLVAGGSVSACGTGRCQCPEVEAAVRHCSSSYSRLRATGRKCCQAGASLGCFAFASRCDEKPVVVDVLDVTLGAS